jgi:hypothetical protein
MSILLGGMTSYNLVTGGMGGDTPVEAARPELPRKLTVCYNNLIDTAQLVTTDYQPGLPPDNLKLQQRKKTWDSQVKIAAPFTVQIEVILSEAAFVAMVGLIEFNLPFDTQIRLQGNSTRSYTSTPFDETFIAREALLGLGEGGFGWGGLGGFAPDIDGMLQQARAHFLGYDVNGQIPYYQNWLWTFTVSTLDKITYSSIGRLWMDQHLEFLKNYTYGYEIKPVDPTQLDESLRVTKAEDIYIEGNLRIANIPDEEFDYRINDFLFSIGKKKDFLLLLDPATAAGRQNKTYYCRAVDPVPRTGNFFNNNTINIHFREETE